MNIIIWICIIIILLALIYLSVAWIFSTSAIKLMHMPVVKFPDAYGMKYENIEFKSTDGVTLKGWVIHGSSDNLVIMTHPGGFNRHGLMKKYQGFIKMEPEVDFLLTAKQLHNAGYSVVMFDFRNHGESEKSANGGKAGVGLFEYQDVLGALRYVNSQPELKDKKKAFVSFCMGANSTIIANSKSPQDFADIKCIAAIQPVTTDVFVRSYARDSFGELFVMLVVPLIRVFVKMRIGFTMEEMSPKEYIKDITVPLLLVQAKNDPWTEISDTEQFFKRAPKPKQMLWLEGDMARFDTYNYFSDNPKKLLDFLHLHITG